MPSVQEFADRWKLSNVRVQQLRDAGMPLDSFEAAEAWRMKQKGGLKHMTNKLVADATNGEASPTVATGSDVADMDDFSTELETQRLDVRIARRRYHQALRENSKDAPKYYTSMNKAIEQLFKTRDKLLAHRLATGNLINAQTALDSMKKVLSIITQRWEANEIKMAMAANPDDKAKALKALRDGWQAILAETYGAGNAACLSMFGKPLADGNASTPLDLSEIDAEAAGDGDEGAEPDLDEPEAPKPV